MIFGVPIIIVVMYSLTNTCNRSRKSYKQWLYYCSKKMKIKNECNKVKRGFKLYHKVVKSLAALG